MDDCHGLFYVIVFLPILNIVDVEGPIQGVHAGNIWKRQTIVQSQKTRTVTGGNKELEQRTEIDLIYRDGS